MSEGTESISVDEARKEIAGGDGTAIDVRSEEKWGEGHVPGAIHLPDGDPESGSKKPEEGTRLLVIGEDTDEAKEGASKLAEAGYEAVAVKGGMGDWASEDYPIQPTDDPDEDTELGLN